MIKYLEKTTKRIAIIFNIGLLIAAGIEVFRMFISLYELNIRFAIQNGLFVIILLEMVYVINTFIKKGSINIAMIINVGIVAVVKELIFKLDIINKEYAISFGILLIALSVGLFIELYFNKKCEPLFSKKS